VRSGDRIFAVSGLGGSNASVSLGFVSDVSATAIQHDAAIGQAFQGGPLVNDEGELLAVSSRTYAPLGFGSDGVWFAAPIRTACDKVLRCPNDAVGGAGARR
jgi:S1-C subfamily serine protease